MKLYWGDYSRKTRHLKRAVEHGAYLLLIGALWDSGGKLPADDETLADHALLTPEEWAGMKARIMPFFKVSRGFLTQERVTEELAKYRDTSGKRKMAGKAGGKATHGKETGISQAIAKQMPTQSESESEPKIEEANASFVGSEIATEEPVVPKAKPWEKNAAFQAFWKASGPQMRSRTSQSKVWPVWKRVAAEIGDETLHAALKRYIAQDADYQRTGGPGLHGWLTDGRWEHWLAGGETGTINASAKRFPDEPTRAAVVGKLGEDFARKWMDPSDWIPTDRVIIAPNRFARDQIAREAPALKSLGIASVRIAQAEGAQA